MKQRFSKRTRLVSALLTLAMVFTFLPFSAFAANTEIDFNSPDFKLNFPDEEFRRFLKECCDKNGDGKLDVDIKNMTIPTSYAIKSLEGIRFFEDLEKLDCHGIGLTTLNVGKNFKLKELDCSGNQLKECLPILSSGLKKLNCSNNKLTHMNLGILSGLNLEEVNCSNNNITNIVMDSVGELVKFDCSNNDLMALDVSQCFKLKELNCSGNQLMELDVGHQTQLTQLDCSNNKLTELNVKQNGGLISLICNDNQLTTLDLSQNHSLSKLNCAKNRLACVDVTGISGGTITANGNRRPIAVRTDGKFDLTTLPGFDVGKATNWNGGSVSGTILTVENGKDEVSYQYNCGNGVKPTFIFETSLPINKNNFPDDSFRNYIKTYKAGGRDVLTVEEQRKVETIEVEGKNISSLRGIEAFPNLTELDCGNNSIQKLDLRQNPMLITLKCNKNQLTQLDLSKNPDIDYLNCSENQLEQLDVSHLKLEYLYCSHNDLEQLDVKNSKWLRELDCSKNELTVLDVDVIHKPNLVRVECQNNQLTSLILGENKMLRKLNCANNQLTQLNLNNMISLTELNCANNQLTVLICAGNRSTPSHYQTVEGFEDYIAQNAIPLHVLKIYGYENERELSIRLFEELDTRTGIAGAFSVSARLSILLANEVRDLGKQNEIRVIASDLFPETIQNMELGIVKNIIYKNPEKQAYRAAQLMSNYVLKSQKPPCEVEYVESHVIFRSSLDMYRKYGENLLETTDP